MVWFRFIFNEFKRKFYLLILPMFSHSVSSGNMKVRSQAVNRVFTFIFIIIVFVDFVSLFFSNKTLSLNIERLLKRNTQQHTLTTLLNVFINNIFFVYLCIKFEIFNRTISILTATWAQYTFIKVGFGVCQ